MTNTVASFDSNKKPTLLSYDVPQPSSYAGRNYIELDFTSGKAEDYFNADLCKQVTPPDVGAAMKMDQSTLVAKITADLDLGLGVSPLIHSKTGPGGTFKLVRAVPIAGASTTGQPPVFNVASGASSGAPVEVSPDKIAVMLKGGLKMNVYKSMFGTAKVNCIPAVPKIRPRIIMVETHRLSSYLGSYGVGRVLSTTSLLPGEKTRITVRTYTKESTKRAQAASILDSFTQESADDFESCLQSEQSQKDASSESFEYHAEAEAEAKWGWGKANVSGGMKGSTNSSREEFSKNACSATTKHAQKASAKRDIQINTSYETTTETGAEQETVREIQNINVSRTLTFVFRQMNQEFITIHHLVDVRLAFFNGDSTKTREYTLPELQDLLNDVIVPAKRNEVRKVIEAELPSIQDYQGKAPTPYDYDGKKVNARSFVEQKPVVNQAGAQARSYWSFARDLYSVYQDSTGNTISGIQGVILGVTKNVMRTDGIIVDTILGGGDGLDTYSQALQNENVRARKVDNDVRQLGIDVVNAADAAKKVEAYATTLRPAPAPSPKP